MKKFIMVPLLSLLMLMFCFSGVAFASDDEALPNPGINPDSPFYFIDTWGKQIALTFTFKAENKVQKTLNWADERLAEMNAMMAQNKVEAATKAANGYQKYMVIATQNMERARLGGVDVSEAVVLRAEKHLRYLNNGAGDVPEDAKTTRTQIRERAMVCQETALKAMAQGNPVEAAQLNLQLMERQLNRIQVQAEEPQAEGLQEQLQQFNRLQNLGEDIYQIARQLGKDVEVDQLVGQATANQLQILAQVHQCLQGEYQLAVEATIQNCIQNHEMIVTRLQDQNQLGQVPVEAPISNAYQGSKTA